MSASKRADGGTPSLSATRPIIFMPIIVALPRVCDPSTQRGLPSVAKGGDTGAKTQDVVRMAPSRMLSDEVQRRLLVYEDTLRKV